MPSFTAYIRFQEVKHQKDLSLAFLDVLQRNLLCFCTVYQNLRVFFFPLNGVALLNLMIRDERINSKVGKCFAIAYFFHKRTSYNLLTCEDQIFFVTKLQWVSYNNLSDEKYST